MNFEQLCDEHRPWAQRNFGEAQPDLAMLGISEELGEYATAHKERDRNKCVDALGDMLVFLADYLRGSGAKRPFKPGIMHPMLPWRVIPNYTGDTVVVGLAEAVGQLSHAHLKNRQGIRGTAEERAEKVNVAVQKLFSVLTLSCLFYELDVEQVIAVTWAEVSKRNWTANPLTGS